MSKIVVGYYHVSKLLDMFEHNQEFEYSREKINEIQNTCLDNGLSYMTIPYEDYTIILIGKGKLSQR